MNAGEIEEAISTLAEQPFDGGEFPFAFLRAFGNKDTTIMPCELGRRTNPILAESCRPTTFTLPWQRLTDRCRRGAALRCPGAVSPGPGRSDPMKEDASKPRSPKRSGPILVWESVAGDDIKASPRMG